jgi:glycosyltransferase involved in cell wall biosynthesis
MIHTNRVGEGNHDIVKLSEQLYPNRNILFSTAKVEETILNRMYNTFDVTVNTASNEGFGLTTLESLAAGTPIICTNTGGLSSQILKNNDWGIHIEPSVRKLSGDGSTPFIYEDFISSDDVAKALISIYSLNKMDRLGMGKRGREFVEKTFPMERMVNGIANILKTTIKKFKPVNKIKLKKI